MSANEPILVTGAAGQLGAVGRTVTCLLLERGLPVRAMVRREDDRAAALRGAGAEVMVGDLLEPADVYRVVNGCRRIYFGMSVSPDGRWLAYHSDETGRFEVYALSFPDLGTKQQVSSEGGVLPRWSASVLMPRSSATPSSKADRRR